MSQKRKLRKTKYFDLDAYLELLGIDTNKDFLGIFDSERNIGKSTNVWMWIEKNIWLKSNFEWKIAYWRTNIEKLKKVRESFNALFQGKYLMTENRIYKLNYDEEGKEIVRQRQEIGAICGVNSYENYKSNWFVNFKGIFWDEYNEIYQKEIYFSFIDLYKTVKRANSPFFFIACGNKLDGDSDLLVNLEVDVPEYDNGEDYIQWIDKDCFYVNISHKTFSGIEANKRDDIVHRLASKNHATNRYLNSGGYFKQRSPFIKLWKYIDEAGYEPLRTFAKGDIYIEEGVFGEQDQSYFRIVEVPDNEVPLVSLDNYSWMKNGDSFAWNDASFYLSWCETMKMKFKTNSIFFTTNDCLEEIMDFILINTQMLDEYKQKKF